MRLRPGLIALAVGLTACGVGASARPAPPRFFAEIPLSTTYANGNMWTGWTGRWTDFPLVLDRMSGYADFSRYTVNRPSLERTLREMADYGLDGATYNGTRPALAQHITNGADRLPALYVANLQLRAREPSSFEYAQSIPALKAYCQSPTAWRRDGKPVMVSYWSDRTDTPERMAAKLKELRAALGDFLYVPDVSALGKEKWRSKFAGGSYGEADAEEMRTLIRGYLRVADGVYFGELNGLQRLAGGENTLDDDYYRHVIVARMREVMSEPEFRGKGKILGLVAGLGHGNPTTFGNIVGQDGTRTLRRSLATALSADPDFVVFFEWDEWNENTLIKPSLWNSFAPKRIIRAAIAAARGEPNRPLPGDDTSVPNVVLSFRKTLTPGERADFEILSVPEEGATGTAEVVLRLLDEHDRVVRTFEPARLDLTKMDEVRHSADSADWARHLAIRPELSVTANGRTVVWRDGLPPMGIRLRGTFDHKWATMPLRDIAREATCALAVRPAAEAGLVEVEVGGASAAGIDRLELLDEGEMVYSVPGRAGEDFREDADHYVFRLTAVTARWSDADPLARFTVEGVSEAEWRVGGRPVKGMTAAFAGLQRYTPDAYLRIPRKDAATAVLRLDWPKVAQRALRLKTVVDNGGWAELGEDSFMFAAARFFGNAAFWSAVGAPSARGRAVVKPQMPVSLLCGYLITPGGRLCFSRPQASGALSGRTARLRVYSAVRDAAVDVEADAARTVPFAYDLSAARGVIVRSGAGSMNDGVLGGVPYLATGRNRGGATTFHSCPENWNGRPPRAPVQFEEDGVCALRFDGSGTYFGLPQATVPKYCGYRLRFEFRPEDPERAQELFASGTRKLWGQVPMIELTKGGFVSAAIGGHFGGETRVTSAAKALKGEWNTLELVWGVDTVELVLNGASTGAVRSRMPGRHDCAAWFGGREGRFYKGDLRAVSLSFDRSR